MRRRASIPKARTSASLPIYLPNIRKDSGFTGTIFCFTLTHIRQGSCNFQPRNKHVERQLKPQLGCNSYFRKSSNLYETSARELQKQAPENAVTRALPLTYFWFEIRAEIRKCASGHKDFVILSCILKTLKPQNPKSLKL